MAAIELKTTPARRQAMLTVREPRYIHGRIESFVVEVVPVLVWPTPTAYGLLVVERRDGTVQITNSDSLTFIDSEELFSQYAWNEKTDTCKNLGSTYDFKCSECGCTVCGGDELGHNSSRGAFRFCPNCGKTVSEQIPDGA